MCLCAVNNNNALQLIAVNKHDDYWRPQEENLKNNSTIIQEIVRNLELPT